jgi:hypothetical protein
MSPLKVHYYEKKRPIRLSCWQQESLRRNQLVRAILICIGLFLLTILLIIIN